MSRREKILGLIALLLAMASFHGLGGCVFVYPVLLSWLLAGQSPKRQIGLAALWGFLFEAAFYHWVGAYGLLPWFALSLVRGLPWALYPLPGLLLARKTGVDDKQAPDHLGLPAVVGGALGLGLVSLVLLLGLTGVDWETPAGALVAWPYMLAPLRWVGLSTVAVLIGMISHLLGSRKRSTTLLGAGLLGLWAGLALAYALPAAVPFPLEVALLQTGFSQDEKWDEAHRTRSVDRLLSLTEAAAKAGAKLVVWPETAWPYRGMRRRYTNTRRIGKAARRLKVDIVATSIEEVPGSAAGADWINSVSMVLASGKFSEHYEKRRLAPFAEYLPLPQAMEDLLRPFRPFSQVSRFVSGSTPSVFTTSAGRRFATLICYESMTPTMAAEMAPKVDFLVVVTNDAPFDHAQANEAHFRSAILRAIENKKWVLQAANTGVTGAIEPSGRVRLRTQPGLSGPSVQYCLP